MSTKVELVKDLEHEIQTNCDLTAEQVREMVAMIGNARRGYYHDFESTLATPKVQLHYDLLQVGLRKLDKKVIRGAYDEEPTVEQQRELSSLFHK